MRRPSSLLALTLVVACGPVPPDAGPPGDDAGVADDDDAGTLVDAGLSLDDAGTLVDAGAAHDDGGAVVDGGAIDAGPAFDPSSPPSTVLRPVPGELFIALLDLPPALTGPMGESTIVVGPDGTLVVIDAGNGPHDDDVRLAIETLNTQDLTPARGYPARGIRQVEWVIFTHFHADHVGAFEDLLLGPAALDVTGGVLHRGLVDLGAGANVGDAETVCTAPPTLPVTALCEPALPPACGALGGGVDQNVTCDALALGDVLDPSDDGSGPLTIPLGMGATLTVLAASGRALDESGAVVMAPAFGTDDTNQENGRSVVLALAHGDFRAIFAGDLSGSGAVTEPDVESFLVETVLAPRYGIDGFDVSHASHHARDTSSNPTWIDAVAPLDGRTRTVVAGINEGYIGSPHAPVLARFLDDERLGEGRFWVTHQATGGAAHDALVDAEGEIRLTTGGAGDGYFVQAAGDPGGTRGSFSVRAGE